MLGGHVVKTGLAPLLSALMEREVITHIAMNGSAAIHDFEIALAASIEPVDGNGYLIVSAPGSVYSYGDAPNFGGMPQAVPGYKGRIQGIAVQPL